MKSVVAVLLCLGVACVLGDSYSAGAYSPSLWTTAGSSGFLGHSGSGYGLQRPMATGKGSLISSETIVRTPYYTPHSGYSGYSGYAGAGYGGAGYGGAGYGSMGMQSNDFFGLGAGGLIMLFAIIYILFFNTSG